MTLIRQSGIRKALLERLTARAAGGAAALGAQQADAEPEMKPDKRFDRIAALAAMVFDAPTAAVFLVDEHGPRPSANFGMDPAAWPREAALAEAALRVREPVFAEDAGDDPRLRIAPSHSETGPRFYAAAPIKTAEGEVLGLLCVGDPNRRAAPTEQQRRLLCGLADLARDELARDALVAEARQRSAVDQGRAELALNAANLGDFEWDIETDTLRLSERAQQTLGWRVAELTADRHGGLIGLIDLEDLEKVEADLLEGLTQRGRFLIENRLTRPEDGRQIWVMCAGVLVTGPDRRSGKVIGVIEDISDRKADDQEREALVAELDHRVKNVLASVQSMAAQSARKASSMDSFLKTFSGRLKSMASAHQLLTATRWRGAGMHNIAAAELGGLAPGQTRWEGPDIALTPRATNAMSLALHELATNAVKFGALSTEEGRVDVRWRETAYGGLELRWEEAGGPTVSPPTRRGFGATLLEKVTGRELEGAVSVDYRREGVRVLVTVGEGALAKVPQGPSTETPPPPPESLTGASAGAPDIERATRVEGLRVLIVEDALLLALELEAGLQEAGAHVVGCAADVDEALSLLESTIVDAAVLDANLNGVSVAPVAEALRGRGIPFVFATGYGDSKILPEGFDAPIIRKPYDVTQVAAGLAAVTGRV
jgi:PAS domain S-box-containing protein